MMRMMTLIIIIMTVGTADDGGASYTYSESDIQMMVVAVCNIVYISIYHYLLPTF